jgi:hypothetical protein
MEKRKIGIFLIVSVLFHLLLLMLIGAGLIQALLFQPPPPPEKLRITLMPQQEKKILQQLLQQQQQPPQQKPQFVDTTGLKKVAEANPDAPFESETNTQAASETPNNGNPNLPNQTGEEHTPLEMRESKYSPQTQQTHPSQAQPQDKPQKEQQEQKEQKEQPPQQPKEQPKETPEAPQPTEAQQPSKEKPDDKKADPAEKNQPEMKLAKPSENIPLRPDGNVPVNQDDKEQKEQKATSAQAQTQTPKPQPQQQAQQASSSPPPAQFMTQRRRSALQGGGQAGLETSIESQETIMGRYKAKLYRAIGSRWYIYVQQDPGLLTIGTVRIKFKVNKNGTITDIQIIQGGDSGALLAISRRSIMEVSGQIEPFPKQMQEQIGDSYDEEVSFSIY